MTSLLTVLVIAALASSCYFIAKYNRNDTLFLVLLISLLAGMAGGAIFNKLNSKSDEEKKTNLTQVYNPTQNLPAESIDFYAVLGDILFQKVYGIMETTTIRPSPRSVNISCLLR